MSTLYAGIKTGIDVTLGGTLGVDHMRAASFHDALLTENNDVFYVKSATTFALSHNAYNYASLGGPNHRHVWRLGAAGIADSGNMAGVIRFAIDEYWSRRLWTNGASAANCYDAYSTPFTLGSRTYPDGTSVIGGTGPGPGAMANRAGGGFYWKGLVDEFGDEIHILRCGDDDYGFGGIGSGDPDSASSDAKHLVFIVNPKTCVLTVATTSGTGQFYTTPLWTYFNPVARTQITYINDATEITLTDMDNATIQWRLDGGAWSTAVLGPVVIPSSVFTSGSSNVLEYRCNRGAAVVKARTVFRNPVHHCIAESHGNALWYDDVVNGWTNTSARMGRTPYSTKFATYQGYGNTTNPLSGAYHYSLFGHQGVLAGNGRRAWQNVSISGLTSTSGGQSSLANAITAQKLGWTTAIPSAGGLTYAQLAKAKMLDNMTHSSPVGLELSDFSGTAIPCDLLWYRGYWDVGGIYDAIFTYDFMAAYGRDDQITGGMTAIEDIFFRDSMASWVNLCTLMVGGLRGFYTGMWEAAWRIGATCIACIMPKYSTPYYGTSGMDGVSTAVYPYTPYRVTNYTWKAIHVTHNYIQTNYPDGPVNPPGYEGIRDDDLMKALGSPAPALEGWWVDKLAYTSYAQMGYNLGIYWNMQRMFNPTGNHDTMSRFIDRTTEGSLYGLKPPFSGGPYPDGPSRAAGITFLNNRHPTASSNNTIYIQSLPAGNANSDDTGVADAGTFGFAWYWDDFTGTGTPPPANPTLCTAVMVDSTSVDVGWTDNSGDETGFIIEASLNNILFFNVGTAAANDTVFRVTALNPATHYYFRVRAFNGGGNSDDYTNTAEATTDLPPPTPPRTNTAARRSTIASSSM